MGLDITPNLQILNSDIIGPAYGSQNGFLFMENRPDSLDFIVAYNLVEVIGSVCFLEKHSIDKLDGMWFEKPTFNFPIEMKFDKSIFNAEIIEYWPQECYDKPIAPLQSYLNYMEGSWNCIKVFNPNAGGVFLVFDRATSEKAPHLQIKNVPSFSGGENKSMNQDAADLKSHLRKLCGAYSVAVRNPLWSIPLAIGVICMLILINYYLIR